MVTLCITWLCITWSDSLSCLPGDVGPVDVGYGAYLKHIAPPANADIVDDDRVCIRLEGITKALIEFKVLQRRPCYFFVLKMIY